MKPLPGKRHSFAPPPRVSQFRQPDTAVQRVALADEDQLLLCTDGLTDMVPDEGIVQVLAGGDPAEGACRRLVEEALAAGGKDNVTAVVARYAFPAEG